MRIKRGNIFLSGLQIKSLEKAKLFSRALQIIEEECGIHQVNVQFEDFFICPWIDLDQLNKTPMELFVQGLLKELKNA